MNAVGIDVSKGKSMVAALRPMGEVALLPQEFLHTGVGLEQMAYAILALGEDTRVVMEATGRYHEPVAAALHEYGIYVCVLNPLYIKQSGGGSIRKVKTDKADAMKIAKYGLDNWVDLREYTPMDTVRQQLKLCSRQYNLYMKTVVSLQNNLISLTDKTFPGVNELFSSPERADGHQKWVDFVMTFWHCDCICRVSEKAFTERYQKWCKRKGYHFSEEKALDIYAGSCGHFTTLPKNDNTKLLITTAAQQLLAGKTTLAALRAEMTRLASQLPEYEPCAPCTALAKPQLRNSWLRLAMCAVFPAAVPLWASLALTRLWTSPASMRHKARRPQSVVRRIFGKRCTRSSAHISEKRRQTSRCTSFSIRNALRASHTLYT